MKERLLGYWESVKAFLAKFSKKTKMIAGAVAAGVLVFAVAIALLLNNPNHVGILYNLSAQEQSEISSFLAELGVDYQVDSSGTIMVPTAQESAIMAQLIAAGYPKTGFGYDTYTNNVDLFSTDADRATYELFALQDKLAATIRHFGGVQEAVVNITLGTDKKYVLQEDVTPATATATVFMLDGGSPSAEQVDGIQRLLATSVPGLLEGNVAVLDGNGVDVSAVSENTQLDLARLKMELEREIETVTRTKLLRLLEPTYGEGHVMVEVFSEVDIDQRIQQIISYSPSVDSNGIIKTEDTLVEQVTPGETEAGVPGTETNAEETPIYPGVTTDGNEIYFRDEQSYEYVVNELKEEVTSSSMELENMQVSLTLNGVEMDALQLAELKQFVATASGIPVSQAEEKVAVLNQAFFDPVPEVAAGLTTTTLIMIGAGVGLLLIILIIVLIITRRNKKKKEEIASAEAEALAALEAEAAAKIANLSEIAANMPQTREAQLRDQIREFTDDNPEIAAQLIKNWLRGEDR